MPETITSSTSSSLFLAELFVILEAYHERELKRLQEIRTGLADINMGLLAQTAEKILAVSPNRAEYLKLLTPHIMALLDGGDGPILP